MPIPVIASVTPNVASPSGDMIVEIKGSNFRVAPLATPTSPVVYPSLVVRFGAVDSSDVQVIDSETIQARVPPYIARWPAGEAPPPPPFFVAVSVTNCDDVGVPNTVETGTTGPNAFSYELPKHTDDNESDFAFLIRTLMRRMKSRLLVEEVSMAVSVDYDPDTGDTAHVVQFAKLPAIGLVGPMLTENRFYSINEQPTFDGPDYDTDGTEPIDHVETRVPYTVDATFSMVVSTDDDIELLNLMANTIAFFHANKFIYLDRTQDDATDGDVRYELDFTENGEPRTTTSPNKDNVRSFSAEFVIRGIDIECFSGFDAGSTYGVPNHAIVDRGKIGASITINETTLPAGYAGSGFSYVFISRPGPKGDPGQAANIPTGSGFFHITNGNGDTVAKLVDLDLDTEGSLPLSKFTPPTGTGFFHITNDVADGAARAIDLATGDVVGVLGKSHIPAVDLTTDVVDVLPLNRVGAPTGSGLWRLVNGASQATASKIDLANDVEGVLDVSHLPAMAGGATTATGTGFLHFTSGTQDAAARAIDLSTADTTGTLSLARVAAPTGDGFARVAAGGWVASASAIDLASADVIGVLGLAHLPLAAAPTGTGFTHVTGGAQDAAARAIDLSGADVENVLPLGNVGAPTGNGFAKVVGGAFAAAAALIALGADVSGTLPLANQASPTGSGFVHVTGGARDGAARAIDLSTADTTGSLPLARVLGNVASNGVVVSQGGALASTALYGDISAIDPGSGAYYVTTISGLYGITGDDWAYVDTVAFRWNGDIGSPTLTQTLRSGTGATAGKAFLLRAQQGQLQAGAAANTTGGKLVLASGAAGTGGSGAAGVAGSVQLWAGPTQMSQLAALSTDYFKVGPATGVNITPTAITINGVALAITATGTGIPHVVAGVMQAATSLVSLTADVSGTLPLANQASPTGAGFVHVTGGARDAAARAIDLSTADTTGTLALARLAAPTSTGIPHVVAGAWSAAASLVSLTADVVGVLPLANMSAVVSGTGFAYSSGGVLTARAIDLSTSDVTGALPLFGDVTGTSAASVVGKINGVTISGTATTGYVLTATGTTAATWSAVTGGGGSTTYETLGAWLVASSPVYAQADRTAASTNGAVSLFRAQNATGATSTGGELRLQSGTGTTASGAVTVYAGATKQVQLGNTSLDFIQFGPGDGLGVANPEAATTGSIRLPAARGATYKTHGAIVSRRGLYATDVSLLKYDGNQDTLCIGEVGAGSLRFQGAGSCSFVNPGTYQFATTGGINYRDSEYGTVSWGLSGYSTGAMAQTFTTTSTVTLKHADSATAAWVGKTFLLQAQSATGTGATVGGNIELKVGTGATNGELKLTNIITGTSSPGAGGGGALPAAPTGYANVTINGSARQIAYY